MDAVRNKQDEVRCHVQLTKEPDFPNISSREALIFALDGEGAIGYRGQVHPIKAGENFCFSKGGLHSVKATEKFKMALLLTME